MAVTLDYKPGKILLSFPYSGELVQKAKSIPTAKWNEKTKQWEYEATQGIYELIKETFGIRIWYFEKEKRKIKINKFTFKTKPMKHQREALQFILKEFGMEVEQ